ncbi:MAG TPA: mechanosensitive ion channel [Candidatus Woesearchaeota archaeon]|nr:mechanosensitive ion channel [Candidatus Woesearchaeota archaeon]
MIFEMEASELINRFAIGAFFIFFGIILGKIVSTLLKRILRRIELNDIFSRLTSKSLKLEELIVLFVSSFVYLLFIIIGLNVIGIATIIFNLISVFVLLVILGILLLTLKDFLPNLFAGFFVISRKHLKEGQHVRIDKIEGFIDHIDLSETRIKTKDGDSLLVPNSQFIRKAVLIFDGKKEKVKKRGQ